MTPASSPTTPRGESYQAEPFPPFIQKIIRGGRADEQHQTAARTVRRTTMEKNIAVIRGDCIQPGDCSPGPAGAGQDCPEARPHLHLHRGGHGRRRHRQVRRSPAPVGTGQVPGQRQRAAGRRGRPQMGGHARRQAPRKRAFCACAAAWGCTANNRPAKIWPQLAGSQPPEARDRGPRASTSLWCGS